MTRDERRTVIRMGILGSVFAALVIGLVGYAGYSHSPVQVGAYATPYDQRVLDDPLEILLVQSDGQAFATLARDPSLARAADEFREPAWASYRAQRPLLPYMAWIGSLGQSGWVPPALAVFAVVGTGAAAAAFAALTIARDGRVAFTMVALLLPGFFASLAYLGPEPVGLALAAWAVVMWERDRTAPAVVLFALAALTRETMLLVPAVLLVIDLLVGRRRQAALLVIPLATWIAWVAVLWVRIGALPTGPGQGVLTFPFVGVVEGLSNSIAGGGAFYAVLFSALILTSVALAPRDPLSWVALAYLGFATLMGPMVWASWEYFGRILLPGGAFALIAVVGHIAEGVPPRVVRQPSVELAA